MHYGGGVGRRKAKPQPCLIPDSLAASTPLQISNGLNQAPMGTRYHVPAFLTGSCLRTEMAVTHSKQTTGTFLTGSRIARHRALSARNSQPINAWEYEECSASPRAEACDGKMS